MNDEISYYQTYFPLRFSAGITLRKFGDINDPKILQKLAGLFHLRKTSIFMLNQMHETGIIDVDRMKVNTNKTKGDGILVAGRNKLCIIKTADCAPVIIVDTNLNKIILLHAGRKGVQSGIVDKGIKTILRYSKNTKVIKILVGPCIEKDCYFYDLKKEIKQQIKNNKIPAENVKVVDSCTFCNSDLYYSHKRGDTKRMGTFVMLN